mgnify:CR=1 FL=1
MDVLCNAVLSANVRSREEYDEFVRTIEERLDDVDVVSVEMGEVARIKLDVADGTYDKQRLSEAIDAVDRIEQIQQVETLAE